MSMVLEAGNIPELTLDLATQSVTLTPNVISVIMDVPPSPEVIIGLAGPTGPPGVSGFILTFGPVGFSNVPPTAITPLGFLIPTTTTTFSVGLSGTSEIKMQSSGKIIAAGILTNIPVVSGTGAVRAHKNGSSVGEPICILNSIDNRSVAAKTNDVNMEFVSGDTIGIAIETLNFSPSTIDVTGWFAVVFD